MLARVEQPIELVVGRCDEIVLRRLTGEERRGRERTERPGRVGGRVGGCVGWRYRERLLPVSAARPIGGFFFQIAPEGISV